MHISTSIKGGAAIAAFNLHTVLLQSGIDSRFVTLISPNLLDDPNIVFVKRTFREILVGKILTLLQNNFSKYTFFSSHSQPASALLKFIENQDSRGCILHIHNWYNFFDLRWIVALEKKGFKIFFTLHDQRLFTGGCHYSRGCQQFTSDCSRCPAVPYFYRPSVRRSRESIDKYINSTKSVQIISPSEWLTRDAQKSKSLKNSNIQTIPNVFPAITEPSNTYNWQPGNPLELAIGIASIDPYAEIKGGDFVKQLLHSEKNYKLIFLRDHTADKEIFWKKIDVLLVPSLQDNSPNVIHEAKLRGIPVIARLVGGIPELISTDYDLGLGLDITVENFQAELANFILKINGIPSLKYRIMNDYSDFSINARAKYLDLYGESRSD